MLAAAEFGVPVCGERVPTTPPAGVRSTSCPCLHCQPLQLLASSTISDVQESIAMLLTCKQFEVDGAGSTIRKMLPLIFSKDQGGWRGGVCRESGHAGMCDCYCVASPPLCSI